MALIMVQRQGSMRTISDSWYHASDELYVFGTELIRNLAIWLAESRDYDLSIYKVYWCNQSMFVPIFTSFGIENSSQHSGRPRTFLALISLLKLFFISFCDPRVSTRGIASLYYNCEKYPLSSLKPRGLALLSWHVPYNWSSGISVHPSFTWFLSLLLT